DRAARERSVRDAARLWNCFAAGFAGSGQHWSDYLAFTEQRVAAPVHQLRRLESRGLSLQYRNFVEHLPAGETRSGKYETHQYAGAHDAKDMKDFRFQISDLRLSAAVECGGRPLRPAIAFPNRYVFSAKGAVSYQPGATPQGSRRTKNPSAESAIQCVVLNRAFSAGGDLGQGPGAMPQAGN